MTGNRAAELHVDKYEIAGLRVTLDLRWTNIIDTPYLIPDIGTHLQLIVNGESGATLVMPSGPLRIERGATVRCQYLFNVTASPRTLELAYFDNIYGNIRVAVTGGAAAGVPPSVAGPARSGGLTMTVIDVQEAAAVGETRAPDRTRFVIVTATGEGDVSIGDNFLEIEPVKISRLAEAAGYLYPPTEIEGVDGAWSDVVRFVPATPQRGKLVFAVPAQHGPLTLTVAVPGAAAPMRLPLSPAAAADPPKPPAASTTVPDGDTATFYLYGVRRAEAFGKATAEAGQQFVILDVGFQNRSASGIEFQTKEQITLLKGEETIATLDDDLAATPRALPEGAVVPPCTLGRYDIPFRVPTGASGLTLYYQGLASEKKIPLPPAR